MNPKDIKISVYRGVTDTAGRLSTLYDFLFRTDRDTIDRLRASADPAERAAIKRSLPQATVSGVFAPSRKAENLRQHSGLLCIDIDGKDNRHLPDFHTHVFDTLRSMREVMYASRSVSGGGYFAIVPIAWPELHKEHFAFMERTLARAGIVADHACSDVCRLRCQSYDPDPYINLSAGVLSSVYRPESRPPRRPIEVMTSSVPGNADTLCRVEDLVCRLEQRHIDVTGTYDQWVRVGAALAALGEAGRGYFHRLSAISDEYDQRDTNRKFYNLMRTTRRIGIGTFFKIATDALR